MRLSPLLLALALTLPAAAHGKSLSPKVVDEAMLSLSAEQLAGVSSAEQALSTAEKTLQDAEHALVVARADQAAAKLWVDASNAVLKAIGSSQDAAQAGNRTAELEQLAGQRVRAEASKAWRDARLKAAKADVSYRNAVISWAKADLVRSQAALELAQAQAYKDHVDSGPDADGEVARTSKKMSQAGKAELKARERRAKAERSWTDAAQRAKQLQPAASEG